MKALILISEHLKCFSMAQISPKLAANVLERDLRQYGPTQRVDLKSFSEGKKFISPVKSFTTRFLVCGYLDWSLVVSDMRYEPCTGDALQLSKEAGFCAVALCHRSEFRKFELFQKGETIRNVEVVLDYGRWVVWQVGRRQPFDISGRIRDGK